MKKETIMIDFDGVIHKYSKSWLNGKIYDEPVKGAKKSLDKLSNKFNLIIFTCRDDEKQIKKWLKKYNFTKNIKIITDKPNAILYIDDNGFRFRNWKDVLDLECLK